MVVLATFFYGLNVNMVHRQLQNIPSLHIAALALSLNALPALAVLIGTGYFHRDLASHAVLVSTGFSAVLGILVRRLPPSFLYAHQRAGAVFSSMVTYGIPFVAILGILYEEQVGWKQVVSLLVILAGVYVANRKK